MPRRKAGPEGRTRAAKACVYCRASKKRCDSNTPCGLCVIKGRAHRCTYEEPASSSTASNQRRFGASQALSSPDRQAHPADDSNRRNSGNARESSPQYGQQSTMLLNSKGNPVFIGNGAAISFLQFLQKTLKIYVGPSRFTDGQQSNSMLEVQIPQNTTAELFVDNLELGEKKKAVDGFLRVSNGLLHLFSDEEISQLLAIKVPSNSNLKSHSRRDDITCLYLMIAIGFQARGASFTESKRACNYFFQAQQMAFLDMLQDPSISTIRIFLLMAMYMLGACRRNTAFLYIGIASKAATILGLHIPYKHDQASTEERAVRRRIWMSLRVFDLFCSAILARPSSTPSIQRDEYEIDTINDQEFNHRTLSLSANYECCAIMDSIVQKFALSSTLDVQSVENYLQMLKEWRLALPDVLRETTMESPTREISEKAISNSMEAIAGNVHVACSFYFCVIIITRQFLVSRVISQLRGRRKDQQTSNAVDLPFMDEKSILFSKACIDSAIFMTQLCFEAIENNCLLDNMCILKAWIFSAGLILGFSLLVEDDDWQSVHQDFGRARDCLGRFARLSAQAKQYHEVLSNFSEAIDQYRYQIHLERKHTIARNPYIERITISRAPGTNNKEASMNQPTETQTSEPLLFSQPLPLVGDSTGLPLEFESRADFDPMSSMLGDDIGLQLIWDTYSMQIPQVSTMNAANMANGG